MNCITNMKEKKMSNLSEEIINRYLAGQCSEEELIEVNAWMKESEENARQLFRMEEIYHWGNSTSTLMNNGYFVRKNNSIKSWTKRKVNRAKY